MKRIIFLLCFLWSGHALTQPAEFSRQIDSVLTYLHHRNLFSGVALIGQSGEIVYKRALGLADPLSGATLSGASAFNLASISKQFYTMMIMILHERGQITYDDPVQRYLPEFPYPAITVRHLMTHTSGLPEYFDLSARRLTLVDTLTNDFLLKLLSRERPLLEFQPGTKWQYCNTNYTTLASVLEEVSGISADRFFQQYISQPLGLENTYVYHLKMPAPPPSRAFGLHYETGDPVLNDLVRFDGVIGDGNIYASAEDLYKWDQALYTEKLVQAATFREAIRPARLNDGTAVQYGFGWSIPEEGKVVSHTGGWVGFSNLIVRYLDKNQTLIVLTNGSDGTATNILRAILEGKPYQLPATQLIRNVQILDGTGLPAYTADLRIVNDRIAQIGKLKPAPGEILIDGRGKVLAPGFIDSHSHHDGDLSEDPACVAATNQGITTIVVGQDGYSTPLDSIAALIRRRPVSLNIAAFTGQSTLRETTLSGDLKRPARPEELAAMQEILKSEMLKGSLGLSSGLEYEDAFYSTRQEVIELAKVAAAAGGSYISHIRSEDLYLDEAIDEIIDIGREARIPVQVTHIKIALRSRWGTAAGLLRKFQAARQAGVDISADVYPYTMWSSTPRVLFPKKDFDNPKSALFATSELFDPAASTLVRFPAHPDYEGRTITQIGELYHESPDQALLRIIREGEAAGNSGAIVATSMSESDIADFLRWDHTSICSDGSGGGHPRGHGAFTRVLGKYVREDKVIPLEAAIRKMTALPAERLGIGERGLVMPGYFADLVLFDPATVGDRATIEHAQALSTGIAKVWVNGQLVYQEQGAVANYPGVLIRKEGWGGNP